MQDMLLGDLTPKQACDKVQGETISSLKRSGTIR